MSLRLKCARAGACSKWFESDRIVAYCPECVAYFRERQREAEASGTAIPNTILAVDALPHAEMPVSIEVCGLCGSSDVCDHYGIRAGFGMGYYTLCHDCGAVLDFMDDRCVDDLPPGPPEPTKPNTTEPPEMENEL